MEEIGEEVLRRRWMRKRLMEDRWEEVQKRVEIKVQTGYVKVCVCGKLPRWR